LLRGKKCGSIGISGIVVQTHVYANPKKGNVSNAAKPTKCIRKRNRNISIKLSFATKKPSTNNNLISARLAGKLHIEKLTKYFHSNKKVSPIMSLALE
jgi:hypothetical protein